MPSNLPDKNYFLNKYIPGRADSEVVEFIKSGNYGHVFRVHAHSLSRDFACKIIPRANLVGADNGGQGWREEIEKANTVRGTAVVRFSDMREWKDPSAGIDCIVLIADYIRGPNLRDFIKERKQEITIPFICEFLEAMFDFFNELKSVNLVHGDFHTGNILVEDRSGSLRGPKNEFRVTDFGVAAVTSDPLSFTDDYFQLASILRNLLESFDYASAEPKDQFIFNKLNDEFLTRHLVQEDQTIAPMARNPELLFGRLKEFDDEYEKFTVQTGSVLVTPFDFLSCEQIGNVPAILKALYSDLFLGLNEIQGLNNLVVTGPRGCGKSTVFKNLSLRQKLGIVEADPASVSYIGLYYFCTDLCFKFPRYQLPSREDAWDIPVSFVTSTLLSELLDDVGCWAKKYFSADFSREEARASQKLAEALELNLPMVPGGESFKALQPILAKCRRRAINDSRNYHNKDFVIKRNLGVDALHKACEVLRNCFSFLKDRPFFFFLDDYSAPKVSMPLQSNLNRIFMQRTPHVFFKLSTESPVSFSSRDIDGKEYVESREYNLLNIGQVYLRDGSSRKLQFIEDIFRRRLEAATAFPVKDLGTLVGCNTSRNSNEDGREIRRVNRLKHWGKESLSYLCSGDIHYVINLVRTMVATHGIEAISNSIESPRIPASIQDQCIRAEAGKFLKNLSGSCEYGEKLVAIVTAFGKVANSYLKYRDSQNEEGSPPHQASRIEPFEQLKLGPEALLLYNELLRYSVFIEDFRGKSRRGDVVPRLFLRRFLIPHFNLTFSTRDSIQVEPSDFEQLLNDPTTFEVRFRLKKQGKSHEDELPLTWNS